MITTEALGAFVLSCAAVAGISASQVDEVKAAFVDVKYTEASAVCQAKAHAFPEPDRASFVTGCINRSMTQLNQRIGANWYVTSN